MSTEQTVPWMLCVTIIFILALQGKKLWVEQWHDELLATVEEHKPIFENCGYQAEEPNVELRERLRATVKELVFDNVRTGVIC